MLARSRAYLFPIVLLFIEWLLRDAFSLDTKTLIGPTLGAIGLSLLLPLTIHCEGIVVESPGTYGMGRLVTELSQQEQEFVQEVTALGGTLEPVQWHPRGLRERDFIDACWLFVFLFLGFWVWSLVLSAKHPDRTWWVFPVSWLPGASNWIIGSSLSEMKEHLTWKT